MYVGIQTILWEDQRIAGKITRREIFREAKAAGYEGIELFESPEGIRVEELAEELAVTGLTLTGFTGGSFRERLRLAKEWVEFQKRRGGPQSPTPYLYCDEDPGDLLSEAFDADIPVGLHPHMFKPLQTITEAMKFLRQRRERDASQMKPPTRHLFVMPDTAHSYIAGDDLGPIISDPTANVRCIHLKDWSPEFGRSYQFYSSGFVPLGQGDVKFDLLLGTLKHESYDGWLIVEVDQPENPREAAEVSRRFLRMFSI